MHSKKQREWMAASPPGNAGAYEGLVADGKFWHVWGHHRCSLLRLAPDIFHWRWCWCLLICWCAVEGSRGNWSLDTDVGRPNPLIKFHCLWSLQIPLGIQFLFTKCSSSELLWLEAQKLPISGPSEVGSPPSAEEEVTLGFLTF